MMEHDFIKKILAQKYSKRHGWSFFEEFFYLDGFAIGLQERNAEILAFEIKVTRQDFLKDIKLFHSKQRKALELSNKILLRLSMGID